MSFQIELNIPQKIQMYQILETGVTLLLIAKFSETEIFFILQPLPYSFKSLHYFAVDMSLETSLVDCFCLIQHKIVF